MTEAVGGPARFPVVIVSVLFPVTVSAMVIAREIDEVPVVSLVLCSVVAFPTTLVRKVVVML